ncbi:Fur-regulated basic protein FbpA [Bacillus pseudomycoides]|uniref:Fur-regulated basic protein FbpA n=1 Tax=Bacillus pseudomycoides TaxID=64104 RepID=UPI002FFECD0D
MDRYQNLIEKLILRNIFKLPDGRDLWQGSSEELARLLEGGSDEKRNSCTGTE